MADKKLVGQNYTTPDLRAKVTGRSKYAEDFRAEGMLFARLLLSPYPHARIASIDTSAALAMPGVRAILTADEVPGPKDQVNDAGQTIRANPKSEKALTNEPLYQGEPVLAVAAVDELTAADAIEKISGVIPLSQTLGLWQSLLIAGALVVVSMVLCYYSAPADADARGMTEMGVTYQPAAQDVGKAETPGEWLEYSPIREVVTSGASVILELNHYVFLFLIVGMLLHWRPRSFVQAIAAAVAPVGGVLIQYPLYAGIVRMMTESGIATQMAHFFVAVSTQHTYPVMVGIYSAFLGLFIPSAGGKWLIEAPYMLEAAKTLQVHLGWVVQTYNATEALANLSHPFWMLPLVGILGLKARDIVGYSMLQFVVHVPLVLFLVWILNYTLQYVPPGLP